MANNTNIGIALILSAQNRASAVMDEFFRRSEDKMKAFGEGTKQMAKGMAEIFAAKKGFDLLEKTTDAYGEMEAAGNHLKSTLMGPGGMYDNAMYERLFKYSKEISGHMTGSTAAYLDMMRVMKQNRIEPEDILGGIGEDAAKLAHYFDNMLPAATAEFAAHMKNDMGIATKKMYDVMDLVARVHDAGVGKSGQEAVDEMNQFFSKVGLGLANLHTQGLVASKQMAALGTIFMARGISGQSVGTNFRRIFDGLASAEKLKTANEAAAMFHKHLEFFDKGGHFMGVENFVNQIGKLQGLHPAAVEAILKPFSGKQGLSTDFMQFIANEGLGAYKEMMHKLENQASLNEKVEVMMKGQKMQEAVMASNIENTKASFGAAISAPYKMILDVLNHVIVAMGNFFDRHQKLAKVAGTFIAIASAALMLWGAVRVIKGVIMVMRVLNLTMALNPFVLIAAAAVAAAVLIYTYWDEISAFFRKLWEGIKFVWSKVVQFFSWVWNGVKSVFRSAVQGIGVVLDVMTPGAMIFRHWDKVGPYFVKMVHGVKQVFGVMVNWVAGIGLKFWQAGKNIVNSIWQGMKSLIHKPVELMESMAKKMRAYLPFSPAKEGPLRDIHKVKLVETIAMSLKPAALISAWEQTLGSFSSAVQGRGLPVPGAGGVGGGMPQMVFAPVVNLTGGASIADGKLMTDAMKKMLDDWWRDKMNNMNRVGY